MGSVSQLWGLVSSTLSLASHKWKDGGWFKG